MTNRHFTSISNRETVMEGFQVSEQEGKLVVAAAAETASEIVATAAAAAAAAVVVEVAAAVAARVGVVKVVEKWQWW